MQCQRRGTGRTSHYEHLLKLIVKLFFQSNLVTIVQTKDVVSKHNVDLSLNAVIYRLPENKMMHKCSYGKLVVSGAEKPVFHHFKFFCSMLTIDTSFICLRQFYSIWYGLYHRTLVNNFGPSQCMSSDIFK